MQAHAEAFMASEQVELYAALPFRDCHVTCAHLLERLPDFTPRSVLCFAIPYYTGEGENLSLYAVSRDYHLFMRDFTDRLCAHLANAMPGFRFFGFSDHSPIDERDAAVRCGLGLLGDNGLLITERYGTLVFLGEVISDAPAEPHPLASPCECEHCGACRRACPTAALEGRGDCLSALTQQKGTLPESTLALMLRHSTVWGCDLCQTACPYTRRAIAAGHTTPIPFFWQERLPRLTAATLAAMTDEAFRERAYSWRGRQTIERNLVAFERGKKEGAGT